MVVKKNSLSSILKHALKEVKPSAEETAEINKLLKNVIDKIEANRKKLRIDAEIFVGGSFAKGTMIKKAKYDVDVFIRFERDFEGEDLSKVAEALLLGFKTERIHGSRDYFKVNLKENIYVEVVPVLKIKNPKEAENITDLSYFHVNYAKKNFKGKITDEIILAKAFCHASGCYGAESYVKGFSGYALELLTCQYKSFLGFVKAMAKMNNKSREKIVIDPAKFYKNKGRIMMDMNSAKLQGPIVLVDPTFMHRNVVAALSEETLNKFVSYCKDFLKNPKREFFEKRHIDFNKLKEDATKKKLDLALIEVKTEKQEGDIAGSKLLKFYNYIRADLQENFDIKSSEFEYGNGKVAKFFFSAKGPKEVIFNGPELNDKENVVKFRARHKKISMKNGRIYAIEKTDLKLKDFITQWRNSNADRINEMYIVSLNVV